MARVTTVQSARKVYQCGRCGTTINKGDSYRWAAPGFRQSTKLIRCMAPACYFRGSELTTSKMSEVYAAEEDAQDALDKGFDSREDLENIVQDCIDRVRDVAQEYADAADAMGEAGYDLQERADDLEAWADELDSTMSIIDEPAKDDDLQQWQEDAEQSIRDALGQIPV